MEEVKIAGKTVKLWDLSGEVSYRGIWKNYLSDCDVAFVLIDGSETSPEQLEALRAVFAKIDFGLVRRIGLLLTKADAETFNPMAVLDFLRREKLYERFGNVEVVSAGDADLHLKMQLLVERLLNA